VFGRNPRRTLVRLVIWSVVCITIFKFILVRIEIDGISMLPTYKDHSKDWINRMAYFRHEPQRGDVVGIRLAGIHAMLLKRIIALPGETVAFENGRVLINGRILNEPYEKLPCDWNRPPVQLNSSQYFVVGDNRTMPQQDHTFGECDRDRIIGKVLF
jgi:signal peptidase I